MLNRRQSTSDEYRAGDHASGGELFAEYKRCSDAKKKDLQELTCNLRRGGDQPAYSAGPGLFDKRAFDESCPAPDDIAHHAHGFDNIDIARRCLGFVERARVRPACTSGARVANSLRTANRKSNTAPAMAIHPNMG